MLNGCNVVQVLESGPFRKVILHALNPVPSRTLPLHKLHTLYTLLSHHPRPQHLLAQLQHLLVLIVRNLARREQQLRRLPKVVLRKVALEQL